MSLFTALFYIFLITVITTVVISYRANRPAKPAPPPKEPQETKFARKPLFSDPSAQFYLTLKEALPELNVFAQVSLLAIMEAKSDDQDELAAMKKKYQQQTADFLICTPKNQVLAVIRFDDKVEEPPENSASEKPGGAPKPGGQAGEPKIKIAAPPPPKPAPGPQEETAKKDDCADKAKEKELEEERIKNDPASLVGYNILFYRAKDKPTKEQIRKEIADLVISKVK